MVYKNKSFLKSFYNRVLAALLQYGYIFITLYLVNNTVDTVPLAAAKRALVKLKNLNLYLSFNQGLFALPIQVKSFCQSMMPTFIESPK